MKYNKCEYELSRPLKIDKIPRGGIEEKIVARDKEREELVKRFNLQGLSRLEAVLNVDHGRDGLFEVKGRFWADVVMNCVVTLEDFPLSVEDEIDILLAPPRMIASAEDMSELGDLEQPEPIVNGKIDLGELVAQHLAISLPLYPRKEGVSFEVKPQEAVEKEENNPFIALKEVMERSNKSNK